jgi:hypothetical protein
MRFEILSIDLENRIITSQQPGAEMKVRIDADFKRFAVKWPTSDFVPQPLAIEPREAKIFGPSPEP